MDPQKAAGIERSRAGVRRHVVVLVMTLLVVAGGALRLYHIDKRGIAHAETYVPGIVLPADVSEPSPRLTLVSTLTGSMWDVHPPTWYLGMWFWTKVFGASLFALRFPSALFGVLAILLVYLLGRLETDEPTAVLAAALLAFNGHHIFWSQAARMYSMACAVSLCSTTLLVLMTRSDARHRLWAWLYAVTSLVGLSTLYYFWPLFLTHMVWVLLEWRNRRPALKGVLRLQFLVVILAAPIVTLAIFQSRSSYLREDITGFWGDFVRFGFLLEPDAVGDWPTRVNTALLIGSLVLLAIGVRALARKARGTAPIAGVAAPSVWLLAGATVFSCFMVGVASYFFAGKTPAKASEFLVTGVFPPFLLGVAVLLTRWSPRAPEHASEGSAAGWPLITLLTIVPAAIVAGISMAVPFLASRAMLVCTPYLALVMSAGLCDLWRRGRAVRVAAGVVAAGVASLHVVSVVYHAERDWPRDYQSLGAAWRPELQDGDVVFVERHWETTPVFFYLDTRRYDFVGQNFATTAEERHLSRVWVLQGENMEMPQDMSRALKDFTPAQRLTSRGVKVQLYLRTHAP